MSNFLKFFNYPKIHKEILQKYREYNKKIYLAFIDYSKAFDSLEHEAVWQSLLEQGVEGTYVDIIKNIYIESTARVKLETVGCAFPINRGVRQGDPLSPKLFSAVLEQIFRKLDWEGLGLNINGSRSNHLRFADDMVIMEENPKQLEKVIHMLVEISRNVGLTMNTENTKLMTTQLKSTLLWRYPQFA